MFAAFIDKEGLPASEPWVDSSAECYSGPFTLLFVASGVKKKKKLKMKMKMKKERKSMAIYTAATRTIHANNGTTKTGYCLSFALVQPVRV